MRLNEITDIILGAAINVHKELGPGLLESSYQECLYYELVSSGLLVQKEIPLPIIYKEVKLEHGYRIDLLVEKKVVVEIKSIDTIAPVHVAQILTYMRLSKTNTGLMLNFNVAKLKEGIRRFIL
ncbi:MAG: GxxExxY protein [Flavobacteriales bacterium]|nr:GxxExxY protein [Flavobacteriales bacterium]|tara:strand:+ start:688 stop:1059 length:372 start_codon:yes stop_codon:yes gene_type:complete